MGGDPGIPAGASMSPPEALITSASPPIMLIPVFPHSSVGKESACNAGDMGSIPGLGRSPGEGNGYPLQYSCLENIMNRGAWQGTVHGAAKLEMTDFHLVTSELNFFFSY